MELTEPQLRTRFKSLVDAGLVEKVDLAERGVFDLYVFAPYPEREEREKPRRSYPLFEACFGVDFRYETHSQNENEVRNGNENETENAAQVAEKQTVNAVSKAANEPRFEAAPLEENNINNIINKTNNQPEVFCCDEVAKRPATDDVRRRVDFADPRVAALRAKIVERVWEPTLHADLVDRLTAAVVLLVGGATRSTVFALIREARDEKTLYERSNGRAGKRTIWQTATLRLKRLFENAGWVWSPTRFADEPRPTREPTAIDFERSRLTVNAGPTATPERSVDELLSVAAGFEPSELDLSFADFSRLVARRREIADACESRGVALEIRNALRELAKRELATA